MRVLGLAVVIVAAVVEAQDQCRTPNGDGGTCILLENCDPLKEINSKPKKTSSDLLFLRQSGCGLFMNVKPKVCCPPKSQWSSHTTIKPSTWPTVTNTTRPTPAPPTKQTSATTLGSSLPDLFNTIGGPEILDVHPLGGDGLFPEYESTCKPTIKPPAPESLCCGIESSSLERIIGGKYAAIDQFPWLALLEYNTTGRRTPCGGTLVSSRYVLTAAHCLGATIWGTAYQVRLAEYNTSSYPTDAVYTAGGGVEFITVVMIGIEKQIPHPNYKRYSDAMTDDIGLVKLTRNAPYTDFIRPICLPVRDIKTMPDPEDLYFLSTGFGSDGTRYSDVKQQISLPYVPLAQCQVPYSRHKTPITLQKTHLCAGGQKNKDTCGGDSGGPLMYEAGDTFVLVGVVSFGSNVCGTEGTPGVYTHVYEYLSWIVDNMV